MSVIQDWFEEVKAQNPNWQNIHPFVWIESNLASLEQRVASLVAEQASVISPGLSTGDAAALTTNQAVNGLTTAQVAALTTDQAAALSTSDVSALGASDVQSSTGA